MKGLKLSSETVRFKYEIFFPPRHAQKYNVDNETGERISTGFYYHNYRTAYRTTKKCFNFSKACIKKIKYDR